MSGFEVTPTDHLERAVAELRRGAVMIVDGTLVASAAASGCGFVTRPGARRSGAGFDNPDEGAF